MRPTVDPQFKFIAGDVALDFVNTVEWAGTGPVHERLADPSAIAAWGVAAGVLTPARGRAMRRAAADAAVGQRVLRRAHSVRRVLKALFGALGTGAAPAPATVRAFTTELRRAMSRVDFVPGRSAEAGRLSFSGEGEVGCEVLDPVLHAAVRLATSPEVERIRVCAAPDCGWMYVDRSRNGMRRWCEMATCGSQQKARFYYQRKRDAAGRAE